MCFGPSGWRGLIRFFPDASLARMRRIGVFYPGRAGSGGVGTEQLGKNEVGNRNAGVG